MNTTRARALVSLAALAACCTLEGCASTISRAPWGDANSAAGLPATISFSNESAEHVRVYLVSERHEWPLGRVEGGAKATLRFPEEALADDAGWMRLVVLAGDGRQARPAPGTAAPATAREPVATLLRQRWTFAQRLDGGQLTWLPVVPSVMQP